MMEKKKFKETGFGRFVQKVGKLIPDALDIADELVTGGKVGDAIDAVKGKLDEKARYNQEAKRALLELEQRRREWILEYEKMYLEDVANARQREVELAKAGQRDYFQYVVGSVALVVFTFLVYFLAYKEPPESNRELFIHLLGIVEGVSISIFTYYFGSSKGSKDKSEMMKKM